MKTVKPYAASRSLTVPLWRSETTETPSIHGGMNRSTNHRVPNGSLTGTVELYLDLDALVKYLGEKALRSKRGRSVAQSGMIEVRVRRDTVRRTPASA